LQSSDRSIYCLPAFEPSQGASFLSGAEHLVGDHRHVADLSVVVADEPEVLDQGGKDSHPGKDGASTSNPDSAP
jgi:hypothetical protein